MRIAVKKRFLFFALAASLALCGAGLAESYFIDWFKVAGGGGTSTNGQYALSGTIGQHDAGQMSDGPFTLTGGFWALPTPVQMAGAPTLTIGPDAPGFALISWTPATPGFVLQFSAALGLSEWTNAPSGATNPIVVPASAPTRFYRLIKP